MTALQLRRAAPIVYALAVLIAVLFADDALVGVAIVGGILLGLLYVLTGRSLAGQGRNRNRQRNR